MTVTYKHEQAIYNYIYLNSPSCAALRPTNCSYTYFCFTPVDATSDHDEQEGMRDCTELITADIDFNLDPSYCSRNAETNTLTTACQMDIGTVNVVFFWLFLRFWFFLILFGFHFLNSYFLCVVIRSRPYLQGSATTLVVGCLTLYTYYYVIDL